MELFGYLKPMPQSCIMLLEHWSMAQRRDLRSKTLWNGVFVIKSGQTEVRLEAVRNTNTIAMVLIKVYLSLIYGNEDYSNTTLRRIQNMLPWGTGISKSNLATHGVNKVLYNSESKPVPPSSRLLSLSTLIKALK